MIKMQISSASGKDIHVNTDTAREAAEVLEVLFKNEASDAGEVMSKSKQRRVETMKATSVGKRIRGDGWTNKELSIIEEAVVSTGNGSGAFTKTLEVAANNLKKENAGRRQRSASSISSKVVQFRRALFKTGRTGYLPSAVRKYLKESPHMESPVKTVPVHSYGSNFLGAVREA